MVIEDKDYADLMKKHIEELVLHFFEKQQHFGILCKIEDIAFEPELPDDISADFRPLTLFFLAGYTFETAHFEDGYLRFEAGFGSDNFGSVVSVPILSIMQIIIDETPIFINLSTYKPLNSVKKLDVDKNGLENSMESFLSNPENSKFLKK
jgi:hypothetical protein